MTVAHSVDPRSAAYLAASAKIPPAAQGAFNLNLPRVAGTPTMVSMPLASFEKIAEHFERLQVHPPSYEVVKPTAEFGHRFHRWDKEDKQAQQAFDNSQDLLQDVGLEFPDYAGFFFGQVTMSLATYQEMAHRIHSNFHDGRDKPAAPEPYLPTEDELARLQLISMRVFGTTEGPLHVSDFGTVTLALDTLDQLVDQTSSGLKRGGIVLDEPEQGPGDDMAVPRETIVPMNLTDVAMLCAHGYVLCAPCDHIPTSWKIQP